MGRLTAPIPGQNTSGIIFYRGNRGRLPPSGHEIRDEEAEASAQESKKKANIRRRRSSSIQITSNTVPEQGTSSVTSNENSIFRTTSFLSQANLPPLSMSSTQDLHNFPPSSIIFPDSPSNLRQHAGASAQILLRLLKDACDIFQQVPYVKVVAGLVQEIIKISEEVDANNDNITQFIRKIITLSQVVFEELIACHDAGYYSQELSDVEKDLLDLEFAIRSAYNTLQFLITQGAGSRFTRIVLRNDIASKISAEDKNLDGAIAAFQIKSASRVRISVDKISDGVKAMQIGPLIAPGLAAPTCPHRRIPTPAKPQIFFGRKEEVDKVVDALVQGIYDNDGIPARICLLGVGGIGKTTLALSILHHEPVSAKFGQEKYFLPCDAITSVDLLLAELVATLDMSIRPQDNALKSVLRKLKQAPCLLVLDNFETPWEPLQTRSEVESVLAEITSINTVSLILTMRGSQMPAGTRWSKVLPPLQPVDANSAIAIFKSISQREADKYVVKLIEAMDYVPLAVTLIANLVSVDGETAENLWIRWQEEHTSMVENGSDRLSNLEKSIQLTLLGPRMQKDPGALQFLSSICLLPDGMSPETLRDSMIGFPSTFSIRKAISTLRQNALVYENPNKFLRVLSPIRLYVLLRHPPSSKSRQFIHHLFMSLALQASSSQNINVRRRIGMEAANINAILVDALHASGGQDSNDVAHSILSFCQYTYISGIASTHAISSVVEKLEQQQEKLQLESAISPSIRQEYLRSKKFQIIKFPLFRSGKSVATTITKESTPAPLDPAMKLLADCIGCWGQILTRQSQFALAKEKYDRAKVLHTKSGDVVGQAYDILNFGLLLSREFENADQVLKIFEESIKLHEKAGDMMGKAWGLMAAGGVLSHISKFKDAKVKYETADTILENTDNYFGKALALHGLGTIMLALSRFEKAEKYFRDAAWLNTSGGHIVGQAENLTGLSLSLLMRSRLSDAQREIESAIALQKPAVEAHQLCVLGRTLLARANFEQAKVNLSYALSLHEATGDIPGQAYDLLYLAYVALFQGDPKSARNLISQVSSSKYQPEIFQAELTILRVRIPDPTITSKEKAEWLEEVFKTFSKIGNILEQANCLHIHGVHYISLSELTLAMESLEKALKLHVEVGNIEGQADDLNRIAEVLLLKGSLAEATLRISEALVLHVQIEDLSGQGNDHYIQSAIFLAKDNLMEADLTIRKAIELHKRVESKYGQARDFAILSTIVWRQSRIVGTENCREEDAFTSLEEAMQLFAQLEEYQEYQKCEEQKNVMQKALEKSALQQY